jgi:hypothetical protein
MCSHPASTAFFACTLLFVAREFSFDNFFSLTA